MAGFHVLEENKWMELTTETKRTQSMYQAALKSTRLQIRWRKRGLLRSCRYLYLVLIVEFSRTLIARDKCKMYSEMFSAFRAII